jgi:hypothetical protein
MLGAPVHCHHRWQVVVQLVATQGPTFGAQALPRRFLGPPAELEGDPPSHGGTPAAMETLVQRHEPGHLLGIVLAIVVVAHVRRGVVLDVVGVILQVVP